MQMLSLLLLDLTNQASSEHISQFFIFYLLTNRFYLCSGGNGQEIVRQILPSSRRTHELRSRDTLTVDKK